MRLLLAALILWAIGSVLARVVAPEGAAMALFRPSVSSVAMGAGALLVLTRAAYRPGGRPWVLLGAGLAVWSVADVLTLAGPTQGVAAMQSCGLVYLAALALLGSGLLALAGDRPAPEGRAIRLDAVTTGLAVAAVLAWLAVQPVREGIGPDAPLFTAVLHVALMSADALMLVLTIVGLARLRWRPDAAWALATAAMASLLVAEAGYALGSAAGTWSPVAPTNAGWSAAAVLLAWAAWSPSRPRKVAPEHQDLRDVLLPFVFSLASVALLVAARWLDVGPVAVTLAAASLVSALIRLMLTALEHGALLRASRTEARTDPLTGLGNRRRLADDLDRALARDEAPTALVLFDLDGFKGFNDQHGHPAGDALLVALGGELAAQVQVDRAYRLGGDEFCALVETETGSLPLAVANAAAALGGAAQHAGIGSSHGWVVLGEETGDAAEALAIADERLYGAKARGRDAGAALRS